MGVSSFTKPRLGGAFFASVNGAGARSRIRRGRAVPSVIFPAGVEAAA